MKFILKTIIYTIIIKQLLTLAYAKELDNYQIELLFFKHKTSASSDTEQFEKGLLFPQRVNTLSIPKIISTIGTTKSISPIKMANLDNFQLNSIKASLKRSSQYRVLLHTGWQQQGLDKKNTFNVRIRSGAPFVLITDINDPTQKDIAVDYHHLLLKWNRFQQNVTNKKTAAKQLPDELFEYLSNAGKKIKIYYALDGNIRVVRTRFLHLYTDLIWNTRIATSTAKTLNEQTDVFLASLKPLNIQSYPFKSHRKMRSKRQHFIDNPKIGLIAIIMPVKKIEGAQNRNKDVNN
jgi:hypothetical protein